MKRVNYIKLLVIPILIVLALLTSFCNQRESQVDSTEVAAEKNKEKFTTKEAKKDAAIVVNAVAENHVLLRLGDLAIEKSRDAEIKITAQLIKDDHAKLLADLSRYAALKVITVPQTESGKARKKIEALATETESFNKSWCEAVRKQYKESVANLDEAKNDTTDAELNAWIETALSVYRKNLDRVSAIHNRIK